MTSPTQAKRIRRRAMQRGADRDGLYRDHNGKAIGRRVGPHSTEWSDGHAVPFGTWLGHWHVGDLKMAPGLSDREQIGTIMRHNHKAGSAPIRLPRAEMYIR